MYYTVIGLLMLFILYNALEKARWPKSCYYINRHFNVHGRNRKVLQSSAIVEKVSKNRKRKLRNFSDIDKMSTLIILSCTPTHLINFNKFNNF